MAVAREPGKKSARGYRRARCLTCYLPHAGCICPLAPQLDVQTQFWVLIHPDERGKSTNTARLIGACIAHTRFFPWYRTEPARELLELLADPRFMPFLLVPDGDPALFERLTERPWLPEDKVPAFILLDGTWSQASKIFSKSPYLQGLPKVSIRRGGPSDYELRRQASAEHLSTVEVAIALLAQTEAQRASALLHAYFCVFAKRSLAARHGRSLTDDLPEMDFLHAPSALMTAPAIRS